MTQLEPFEGIDVLSAGVEMPNAAGGLREALDLAPRELHHGEEGYMVLHWKVRKVRFDPVKDEDGLQRVHVLDVDQAAFTDDERVIKRLAEQATEISRRRAQQELDEARAAGADDNTLDGTRDADDSEDDIAVVLQRQHAAGAHRDGLRPGCADCDSEKAAVEEEGRAAIAKPKRTRAPRAKKTAS